MAFLPSMTRGRSVKQKRDDDWEKRSRCTSPSPPRPPLVTGDVRSVSLLSPPPSRRMFCRDRDEDEEEDEDDDDDDD